MSTSTGSNLQRRSPRPLRWALAGVLASLAAGASAGQITVYERPGFQGSNLTTNSALADLDRSAFAGVASSVVVNEGMWEACTEANFRGRCAQLVPGSYARPGTALSGPVVSVREVTYDPAPVRIVIDPDSAPLAEVVAAAPLVNVAPLPAGPRITLYQHSARGVRAVDLPSNVDDLDTRGFENRADAAFVTGGVWRLCDSSFGRGQCADFSPGRYETLGTLDGRVRSAYLIAPVADRVAPPPVASGRAVLYEYPNFAGATAVVERGRAPDLDWANFKNPATSLRIESGTWLLCSDIGYQGECRVLEPGQYPVLTGLLDKGIYSARQVWRPAYGALQPQRP